MGDRLPLSPLPGLNQHPLPAPTPAPPTGHTYSRGAGGVSCQWPRCASLRWRALVFVPQLPPHSAPPSISRSHINASLVRVPEIDLYFSLELCYRFICPSGPLSAAALHNKYLCASLSPSLLYWNFVWHRTVLHICKFFPNLK